MSDHVGNRIKTARQRKGMSQQELAEITSVSQPTVANWEKGSHAPRHTVLGRIAIALDSSASWLLGDSLNAMSRPILQKEAPHHHIPVLSWPASELDLNIGGVTHYVSASSPAARPIALIVGDIDQGAAHFAIDTLIIFDRADTERADRSFYLIETEHGILLRRYSTERDCFLEISDINTALAANAVTVLARAVMIQQTV